MPKLNMYLVTETATYLVRAYGLKDAERRFINAEDKGALCIDVAERWIEKQTK